MQGEFIRRILLCAALSVLFAGVLPPSPRAVARSLGHSRHDAPGVPSGRSRLHLNPTEGLSAPAVPRLTPPPGGGAAQGGASQTTKKPEESKAPSDPDMIVIWEMVGEEEEKAKPSAGPPSKEKLIKDEVRMRAKWAEDALKKSEEASRKAQQAKNDAERQVYEKEARLKAETAAALKRSIIGPAPTQPSGTAQPSGTGQASGNAQAAGGAQLEGGSRIKFASGAFEQLKLSNEHSHKAAGAKSNVEVKIRATQAFGDGRAGAGGVALYKPANMLTPLEPSRMTSALVEDARLVLVYGGEKLRFPALDPQFLALAIRSVYGGEGLVKGKLLADEKNAVVLQTGREQYGDVVWKKEFFTELPPRLTPGEEVALELGPGVGVLDLPDPPSHDRVTYYGPLKGNVLGQVLQESDMVFSMFWYGVDWKTGMPIDPAKHPGFESAIDIMLKQTEQPRDEPQGEGEKPKNWWDETVWFVWVPDEISLQLAPQKGEFEFVRAAMKVAVWGVREETVSARSRAQGEYLTQHYDDFSRAFPVLSRLKEAAKAVAVVRWLKQNKVPLDLAWARSYPLAKVDTPEKIRRFTVYIYRDRSGKPLVDNP